MVNIMTKTALLFSGQGSQYAEMGKELVERFTCVREVFTLGSEIIGFNLREKIDNGELESTLVVQPAVFAMSVAALYAARESGIVVSEHLSVAGHSLGEYAALVVCGAVTLENGFNLLKIRSEVMHKAAQNSKGGMAAVLGCESAVVEKVCLAVKKLDEYVEAVNYNSPKQTVIAGTDEGLSKAEELLKAEGVKKVIRLKVAAAFHSALMKEAAEEFKERIAGISFKTPEIPFYSNVTGNMLNDFSDFPEYLARHIYSPVRFTDQLHAMRRDGFNTFAEFGPGKVLSGLVGKTLTEVKICNIEDLKSLETAKEVLK
ncbi:MAG: ACP S-malonyltransferase [Oscillospiraceae bacterium]|nr:ACP S-malonyltransferase [Oscillospiraceae bacterium]